MDIKQYCDGVFKNLVEIKAGLFDVLSKMEEMDDAEKQTFSAPMRDVKTVIAEMDAGIGALTLSCPTDWLPRKREMDEKLEKLRAALAGLAEKAGLALPDTTAWV